MGIKGGCGGRGGESAFCFPFHHSTSCKKSHYLNSWCGTLISFGHLLSTSFAIHFTCSHCLPLLATSRCLQPICSLIPPQPSPYPSHLALPCSSISLIHFSIIIVEMSTTTYHPQPLLTQRALKTSPQTYQPLPYTRTTTLSPPSISDISTTTATTAATRSSGGTFSTPTGSAVSATDYEANSSVDLVDMLGERLNAAVNPLPLDRGLVRQAQASVPHCSSIESPS